MATGGLTLAGSLVLWLALVVSLGIMVALGIHMRRLATEQIRVDFWFLVAYAIAGVASALLAGRAFSASWAGMAAFAPVVTTSSLNRRLPRSLCFG